MDPVHTLIAFLTALEYREPDEALEHAQALVMWLKRGGYDPLAEVQVFDDRIVIITK